MQWWFKEFYRGDSGLKMRSVGASHQKLKTTNWDLPKNSMSTILMVVQQLKQIGKVIKLDKWVPHELTTNQNTSHFKVSSYLILSNNEPFLNWIVMCRKMWILYDKVATSSVGRLTGNSKALPKPNLHQKEGHSHCLMACGWSDPIQLPESQWNHDI